MNNDDKLVTKLSFEEKIKLLSGSSFWETTELLDYDLPQVKFSYGPIGIVNAKEPQEISLPAPSAVASSWNKRLLYKLGVYLGNQAEKAGIDALIAADASIKRHPLNGKGFLLYGEDPVLNGTLVSNLIRGINQTPTKAIIKTFTALSQESYKRSINAIIDEYTLLNLYLKPFKMIFKNSKVAGVLIGHNQINGTYATESPLLSNVLLKRWRYRGLLISEWGAINNRFQALKNGVSLEMPQADDFSLHELNSNHKSGALSEKLIDSHLKKLQEFSQKPATKKSSTEIGSEIAIEAVRESIVLLKNLDDILPLKETDGLLILGRLASKPRLQVLGNSYLKTTANQSFLEVIKETGIMYEYSHGYYLDNDKIDQNLINEAVNLARRKQPVLLFLGLGDNDEIANLDRTTLNLPENQIALLKAVAAVNPNLIVVLTCSSAVLTDWDDLVKGLVKVGIAGSGFAQGLYDVLFNKVNPSGKLTETFPLALNDLPSAGFYPMGPKQVTFNESIYVGYRYFSSILKPTKYPFGFGLSYSKFSTEIVSAPTSILEKETLEFKYQVTNHGPYHGKEVVQVYLSKTDSVLLRPKLELVAFEKVTLRNGESKTITIKVPYRDLEIDYDLDQPTVVETGLYQFYTSLYLDNPIQVKVSGTKIKDAKYFHGYNYLTGLDFSYENHLRLIDYAIVDNQASKVGEFNFNSTLKELSVTIVGRRLYKKAAIELLKERTYSKEKTLNYKIAEEIIGKLPLRSFIKMSNSDYPIIYWQDFLNACNQNKWFSFFRKKSKKPIEFDHNSLE